MVSMTIVITAHVEYENNGRSLHRHNAHVDCARAGIVLGAGEPQPEVNVNVLSIQIASAGGGEEQRDVYMEAIMRSPIHKLVETSYRVSTRAQSIHTHIISDQQLTDDMTDLVLERLIT